jgi:2-polyprenyl-3-methyl-5-hydroxy-6-metoxy-1,4-benzoquinol methylase
MVENLSHAAPPILGPDIYSEWRASELGLITEALEARLLLELAGDVAGLDVLDVGCGDGE